MHLNGSVNRAFIDAKLDGIKEIVETAAYNELEIGNAALKAFKDIAAEHKNLFSAIEEMLELLVEYFLKPMHTFLPPTATIGIILSAEKDGSLKMKTVALDEIKKLEAMAKIDPNPAVDFIDGWIVIVRMDLL